jgi:hypothetical protein
MAAVFAAPASAVNLLTEPFTYSNGGIVAVSGGNWTNHSGTGTDITITSGQAVGIMSNAPDDNRTFTAQSATAKTYACFQVTIPSTASPATNYFAHFKDSSTSIFAARVYVMPSGTTFTFGLSVIACASPCVIAAWPTALNYDTPYTIVIDYDATAGSADLWVNPTLETDTKISHNTFSGTGPATGIPVSSFALRQSSSAIPSGTSSWTYKVDNLGVGTDFASACPTTTPTRDASWGRMKAIYR